MKLCIANQYFGKACYLISPFQSLYNTLVINIRNQCHMLYVTLNNQYQIKCTEHLHET